MFAQRPARPWPAVVVHGLPHARAALSHRRPLILMSAPGAGWCGGAAWWRALIFAARDVYPDVPMDDLLDCGYAPGAAMAALRAGQMRLVLTPCPAWPRVAAAAAALGAVVLDVRPPAIDAREGPVAVADWLAGVGSG